MASDINVWTGVGRLVADPELRTTHGGTACCQIRIAVNSSKKSDDGSWEDTPNFINVTVWSKQAETVAKFCKKGTRLMIAGHIHQRTWKAEDGSNRERVGIVAERVQFIEPKPDTAQHQPQQTSQAKPTEDVPF